MKKSIIKVSVTLLLIIITSVLLISTSTTYQAICLVKAIKNDEEEKAREIIEKNPGCVNVFPSFVSDIFRGAIDSYVQYPLATACGCGNEDMVNLLIEAGADINATDDVLNITPLINALLSDSDNRFRIADVVLNHCPDVTIKRKNNAYDDALITCIKSINRAEGNLRKEGIDILIKIRKLLPDDYDYGEALCVSVTMGIDEAIEYLYKLNIKNPEDIHYCGYSVLTCACKYNKKAVVKWIIENNCPIDKPDGHGKTALDYAFDNNNAEIIALLSQRFDENS